MKPTIIYDSWNPFENFNFDLDVSVSISVDTFEMNDSAKYKILLLYLGEPTQTLPHIKIDDNTINKFDKIYTHNSNILEKFSQAEFLAFGSCWIDFKDLNLKKKNHITFVTSTKNFTEGHNLRHKIYDYFKNLDQINGFEIYQHKSPPFHSRRNDFFEHAKYHVAVENCKEKNYFSEKLIDCFATKTIPIYCGCPNIDNFFDVDGMILFDDFEDLKNKINKIDETFYESKINSIEKNYELAKQYYGDNCITKRLPKKIIEYIK